MRTQHGDFSCSNFQKHFSFKCDTYFSLSISLSLLFTSGNIKAKWPSVCRRGIDSANRVVQLFTGYKGPRFCVEVPTHARTYTLHRISSNFFLLYLTIFPLISSQLFICIPRHFLTFILVYSCISILSLF